MKLSYPIRSDCDMVRVHGWKEFENTAREMFSKRPTTTRLSVNQKVTTHAKDGIPRRKALVTLKVTDGAQTINYETTERFYVKRVTSLLQWFTVKMSATDDLSNPGGLKQKLNR